MNTRDAIMAAADHIEKYPEEFDFSQVDIPDHPHCGTPGCALGWIGTFAEVHGWDISRGVLPLSVLGIRDSDFYDRMHRISKRFAPHWSADAAECARCLREYARIYHSDPAPRHVGRTDAELVAALVRKISTEHIPEGA